MHMKNNSEPHLRPMGAGLSLLIFGTAAGWLWVITRLAIPALSRMTGWETVLWWFIAAGLGVFLPLMVVAFLILRREGYRLDKSTWHTRLRFRPLSRRDLAWSLAGMAAIMALSGAILKGIELLAGAFDHTPPFMAFEPLGPGRYWLLAVWFPYWVLNIMGEEILWRGVMLPRQERAFGKKAWVFHGIGWGLFHVAFGWQLLLTLLPIIFVQSWVVQRTRNSWTGVIIHGGINGPSFVAIALGLL
jgi:membrane protease YdiL (CAAX protease family)